MMHAEMDSQLNRDRGTALVHSRYEASTREASRERSKERSNNYAIELRERGFGSFHENTGSSDSSHIDCSWDSIKKPLAICFAVIAGLCVVAYGIYKGFLEHLHHDTPLQMSSASWLAKMSNTSSLPGGDRQLTPQELQQFGDFLSNSSILLPALVKLVASSAKYNPISSNYYASTIMCSPQVVTARDTLDQVMRDGGQDKIGNSPVSCRLSASTPQRLQCFSNSSALKVDAVQCQSWASTATAIYTPGEAYIDFYEGQRAIVCVAGESPTHP